MRNGNGHSAADERFVEAMDAATEASIKAISLRQQIQPYAEKEDPEAAIERARETAEAFEADQEARLFLGPVGTIP